MNHFRENFSTTMNQQEISEIEDYLSSETQNLQTNEQFGITKSALSESASPSTNSSKLDFE